MDRDQAYALLGKAIRDSRARQRLSRQQVAELTKQYAEGVSPRTIGSIERGAVPKRGEKFPSLEAVVAALGWRPGWTDRILAGEDPDRVLTDRLDDTATAPEQTPAKETPSREHVLGLLPTVYAFSRGAVSIGADPGLRDDFDRATERLVASIPSEAGRGSYDLAAYRPHSEGEGPTIDDADRIRRAME